MSLKLITTEKFGDLDCNFYRNFKGEILLSQRQIGKALGYYNSTEAIQEICKKYKKDFEGKTNIIVINPFTNIQTDCVCTVQGATEICGKSNQPQAEIFVDFIFNTQDKIIEKYNEDIQAVIEKASEVQSLLLENNKIIQHKCDEQFYLNLANIELISQYKMNLEGLKW